MSDPKPAETCQVALLVPHPTRTAVLVAADPARRETSASGSPGPARLPSLLMPSAEPLLAEILDAFDRLHVVDPGTAVALRQVVTKTHAPRDDDDVGPDEVAVTVELEPGATDPPDGWVWQDLDPEIVARLEPEASRAAVASWARERVDGWSPMRPPWSYPGWFLQASAWMVEAMAANGVPAVGPPRQHQLWGLSVVLRAPWTHGEVFFKCSPDIFRHEAVVTRALAEQMPEQVPQVLAVEADRGWMVMRDLGAPELGDQDTSLWGEGVVAHARIQQRWLGRTDELVALGLPVRSLTRLAAMVEEMAHDEVQLERMSPELRGRWVATAPAMLASCRQLDELGPGPTLVHGDFHPWNVVHDATSTRVFDWTDAAISHPFVDLATYVFRTDDLAVRRCLVDAAVEAWSDEGAAERSAERVREAAMLGLVVGALYQVQTYRSLLPTLVADGADDDMAGADLYWLERALNCHERGLESPV